LNDQVKRAVLERFLSYVKVWTQSDEASKTSPSTERQWDLLNMLKAELNQMGLQDVTANDGGVLTALLPANVAGNDLPVVAFLAHVDTYPGTSGKDVKPQVINDYDGKDILLGGTGKYISLEDNPDLADYAGETVISSDGTTLLGADDKAGVAEIMTMLEYLVQHPEVKHGPVKVAFTPDEEIGRGTDNFPSLEKFGAHVAYTVDGGREGEVEDETFSADSATVTILGKDVHPGYAKGKMVNAVRVASHLISLFPEESLPETTSGREGYLHPLGVTGDVNKVTLPVLVRDFELDGLKRWEELLESLCQQAMKSFPGSEISVAVQHSYKNMKYYLDKEPRAIEFAMEAMRCAGVKPDLQSIRGGTDGSRLSEMGLPTPNLFAGGRNFHSVNEWVPHRALYQSVAVLVELAKLWTDVRI
jgi:tripeptide aminopeptidase